MSLTEDQKAQCTDAFKIVDEDNAGKISVVQLEYALGVLGKEIFRRELIQKYGESDINLETFYEICAKEVDFNKVEDSLIDAFKIFDPDNTGSISQKDLVKILQNYQKNISKKDIDNIIKEANPDSNGNINYTQFAKDMLAK